MKTLKEFKSEVETLRHDMYEHGHRADTQLVASWVDRLAISLERVSDTLDIMAEELDQLSQLRIKLQSANSSDTSSTLSKSSHKKKSHSTKKKSSTKRSKKKR